MKNSIVKSSAVGLVLGIVFDYTISTSNKGDK